MKKYIKSDESDFPEVRTIRGTIYETGEKCLMRMNGYWVGAGGRHISSYERVDKKVEYGDKGNPVIRQYSMDRRHRFYVETEDPASYYGIYEEGEM